MSMHMIQGVQVHGKSKKKKSPGWRKAQAEHEAFLRKMGIDPNGSKKKEKVTLEKVKPIERDTTSYNTIPTSDTIPANGPAKQQQQYTGDYIVGIATMHKSNLVPVGRGDDPKEYARMRRG